MAVQNWPKTNVTLIPFVRGNRENSSGACLCLWDTVIVICGLRRLPSAGNLLFSKLFKFSTYPVYKSIVAGIIGRPSFTSSECLLQIFAFSLCRRGVYINDLVSALLRFDGKLKANCFDELQEKKGV